MEDVAKGIPAAGQKAKDMSAARLAKNPFSYGNL